MIVKDEEDVLESALAAIADVFPMFAILDQSSTDRTVEIAKDLLGRKLQLITRERDFVLRHGFSGARNLVSEHSSLSWLLHIDADERLRKVESINIEMPDGNISDESCFAGIKRRNLAGLNAQQVLSDMSLADIIPSSVETHTRLYMRDACLRWHSFIHEELWDKYGRLTHYAPLSNLVIDHINSLKREGSAEAKEDQYAWMMMEGLCRTGTEEELSAYAHHHALTALDYYRVRSERFAEMRGSKVD